MKYSLAGARRVSLQLSGALEALLEERGEQGGRDSPETRGGFSLASGRRLRALEGACNALEKKGVTLSSCVDSGRNLDFFMTAQCNQL